MEVFPRDLIAAEYPEAVLELRTIGETQNVPCEWVSYVLRIGYVLFLDSHSSSTPN